MFLVTSPDKPPPTKAESRVGPVDVNRNVPGPVMLLKPADMPPPPFRNSCCQNALKFTSTGIVLLVHVYFAWPPSNDLNEFTECDETFRSNGLPVSLKLETSTLVYAKPPAGPTCRFRAAGT